MRITATDQANPKKWVEIDGVRKNLSFTLVRSKFNNQYTVGRDVVDYKVDAKGDISYLVLLPDKSTMVKEGYAPAPVKKEYSNNRTGLNPSNYNFYCAYIKDITVALIEKDIFKDSMTAINFYKKQCIEQLKEIKRFDEGDIDG